MNALLDRPTAVFMQCAITVTALTHVCAILATLGKALLAMVRFLCLNQSSQCHYLTLHSKCAVKFKLGVK